MAYPYRPVRVTFLGTMFNSQEIWSTGLYLGDEAADMAPPTDQMVAAVAGHWKTWFENSSSKVHNAYTCESVKASLLKLDGKTDLDAIEQFDYAPRLQGPYGQNPLPPQIALVASLRNSQKRGLAVKGRMYLPGVAQGIQPDGKIIDVAVQEMATNFQTLINSINADFAIPGRVVMASLGGGIRPGVIKEVHEIKVGNVYDTQRRRRNALVESYATKSIVDS